MKILILNKWLIVGGVEKVLINYLPLISENSNEIELVMLYDTPDSIFLSDVPKDVKVSHLFDKSYYLSAKDRYNKRKSSIIARIVEKFYKIKEKREIKRRLLALIKNGSYDLVIAFSEQFDAYIPFKFANSPILRWVHSSFGENGLSKRRISYLSQYNKIISITKEMGQQIAQLGIDKNKVTTLYNPIDIENIRLKSNKNISIEHPYIVQVARLDKVKNHIGLIELFSKLVERGIKENLYIIGQGDQYQQLSDKIKSLNLTERCFLLGEIENPYPYMKNARLFLHTSEREGLPTVLLESMALGVPVVAMDCPTGPKEILGENSEFGKLIPMHNQAMFIDAVLELLNNPERWQHYAQQSLIRIQDFSSEKIASQVDRLFKQVIAEHQK